MPQLIHMDGRLMLQSLVLIGGDVAMWATLNGDTKHGKVDYGV